MPANGVPRGVMHVTHGMAEHALRYRPLAEALVAEGWAVYTHDQRGHGETAPDDDALGFSGDAFGWRQMIDDLRAFVSHEVQQHPGVPVVVFGHSMGSFVVLDYITSGATEALSGAILSGPSGPPPPIAQLGRGVARLERWRQGKKGRSSLLQKLSFGSYNNDFKPTRTDFDWLSKDPKEVDKYVEDPRCGFAVTNQLWVELLDVLPEIHSAHRLANVTKSLPIYVFAGDKDPVGRQGAGVRQLVDRLRSAGISDVELQLYPTGRHEMLNEINREQVVDDLKAWLVQHVLPRSEV